MTGPIPFLPTPYPGLDDSSDGVDAFRDTAESVAANFARITDFLPPTRVVVATNSAGKIPATNAAWAPIATNIWAPLTYTIPTGCLALMYTLSGQADALGGAGSLALISMAVSGNGLLSVPSLFQMSAGALGRTFDGCTVRLFLPSQFTIGGKITLTPYRYVTGAGTPTGFYDTWRVSLTAFVRTV